MREIEVAETIIPVAPAAFSAWGMLMTDVEYELAQTVLVSLSREDLDQLEQAFLDLEGQAHELLTAQDIDEPRQRVVRRLDLRYLGQEHTLPIDVRVESSVDEIREAFDELHAERYGHRLEVGLQIVTIRVRAVGEMEKPALNDMAVRDLPSAPGSTRNAYDFATSEMRPFQLVSRGDLRPDDTVSGPAIVDEGTSTTVIFSDQALQVDRFGHLVVSPSRAG
jgi:N-methylhydantoinase A